MCKDPPKFTYYVGINQSVNIECRVLNANPSRITYEWNLNQINTASYQNGYVSLNLNNKNLDQDQDEDSISMHEALINSPDLILRDENLERKHFYSSSSSSPYLQKQMQQAQVSNTKSINFVNEGLTSRFKWRPTSLNDFGQVICKATNEIGTTECTYEIKLGGCFKNTI